MGLIRFLFWAAIFLVATFGFTVLFEHGPTDFSENARKESETLRKMFETKVERKKDESDRLGR